MYIPSMTEQKNRAALQRISAIRQKTVQGGRQPDSTILVRELRERYKG